MNETVYCDSCDDFVTTLHGQVIKRGVINTVHGVWS